MRTLSWVRNRSRAVVCAALAASCAQHADGTPPTAPTATASAPSAPPQPAVDLLATRGVSAFVPQGDESKVVLSTVPVEGQPFKEALHAEIRQASSSEWSVQVHAKTQAPLRKGDAILATFFVRAIQAPASGSAQTEFVFERAGAPYTKSVSYPLRLTPEWRQVQVRFSAQEDYAAQGAQAIFRLGYEPESFEVGGVLIENYGQTALGALPTSEAADRQIATAPLPAEPPLSEIDGGALKIEVSPQKILRPISPYVYGINAQNLGASKATVRRLGGNRGSVYNWENNASNAGKDWHHVNDDWPCTVLGYKNCGEPGAQYANFALDNRTAGVDSIVTVPMLDYASADKNHEVKPEQRAPSPRFVKAEPRKAGPLSLTPDLTDGVVYENEFVNLLVHKLGRADKGGVRFYSLDNEPALWSETHPLVHPQHPTYKEIVERSEATASAILDPDPSAFILGGVMYGWNEYQSLQDAPDAAEFNARYGRYLDYFLASSQELEKKHGKRLIHALDVHWYPEARGAQRITTDDTSRQTVAARLQAPRSLWDPSYKERSWITDRIGQPIRLIPWLLETIAKRYPGTQLTMTEYDYGAGNHISGGLAEADVLGILGREGVYLANYWGSSAGVGDLPAYVGAAFALYRNLDGNGLAFGDSAVAVTVSDNEAASVYAALDTKHAGRLTLIVINKDQQKNFKAELTLGGPTHYTKVRAFTLDGRGPQLNAAAVLEVKGNHLEQALKPLTATEFVFER